MKLTPTLFNMATLGLSIRSVTVDEDPWFVGKDIAEALGYKNVNQAMADQVEDEDKQTMTIDLTSVQATPARKGRKSQDMVIINESGLYGLILGSSLSSAKEFKRWVTREVLPSIRKTGGFIKGVSGKIDPLLEKAIYSAMVEKVDEAVRLSDELLPRGSFSKVKNRQASAAIASILNLDVEIVRQMTSNPNQFKESLAG